MQRSPTNIHDYSKTDLVIYHGGCPDGVAGAWCFWTLLNKDESKFHAGKFKETPPDVTGKHVVFVDFSYSEEIIRDMLSKAASVRILDHHKTALPLVNITADNYSAVIDMKRSGAHIAWDELYGDDSGQGLLRPWFIKDIGDRDLWEWNQVGSVDTCMAMYTLKYYESFTSFDTIRHIPREYFVMVGNALNAKNKKTIDSTVARAVDCIATSLIDPTKTWKVRVVECDHDIASEVGNKLVLDGLCDFSIMFRYNVIKDEWWCSARADKDRGVDLSVVLKHFDPNAGGHAAAAGFSLTEGKSLRSILTPAGGKFADMQYAANNINQTNGQNASSAPSVTNTPSAPNMTSVPSAPNMTSAPSAPNKSETSSLIKIIARLSRGVRDSFKSSLDSLTAIHKNFPNVLQELNIPELEKELDSFSEPMQKLIEADVRALSTLSRAMQVMVSSTKTILENSEKVLSSSETAVMAEKILQSSKSAPLAQTTSTESQPTTQPPGGPSIEQLTNFMNNVINNADA